MSEPLLVAMAIAVASLVAVVFHRLSRFLSRGTEDALRKQLGTPDPVSRAVPMLTIASVMVLVCLEAWALDLPTPTAVLVVLTLGGAWMLVPGRGRR